MDSTERNISSVRKTKQKNLILECLKLNSDSHITADELVEKLKQHNTPVARATVYRHLASLEEGGIVRKYLFSEGSPACYQFIGEQGECHKHYHLMCMKCSKIIHFENSPLQSLLEDINASDEFKIDVCKTVFYGKCKDCVLETGKHLSSL